MSDVYPCPSIPGKTHPCRYEAVSCYGCIKEAEAQRGERLREYAQHKGECEVWHDIKGPCTCGLEALLKGEQP